MAKEGFLEEVICTLRQGMYKCMDGPRDDQITSVKALWQGQTGMFEDWLFSPLSFETFSLNCCADMPFVSVIL